MSKIYWNLKNDFEFIKGDSNYYLNFVLRIPRNWKRKIRVLELFLDFKVWLP